jgi:hypothetical protein
MCQTFHACLSQAILQPSRRCPAVGLFPPRCAVPSPPCPSAPASPNHAGHRTPQFVPPSPSACNSTQPLQSSVAILGGGEWRRWQHDEVVLEGTEGEKAVHGPDVWCRDEKARHMRLTHLSPLPLYGGHRGALLPCWWILKTTACGPDARRRRLLRAVPVGASSGARRRAWGLAMDRDSPNSLSKMRARLWQHGTAAHPLWLRRRKLPTLLPNDRWLHPFDPTHPGFAGPDICNLIVCFMSSTFPDLCALHWPYQGMGRDATAASVVVILGCWRSWYIKANHDASCTSNQTLGMAIAHVATTCWCCDIILIATCVMHGNTLSCSTHSSLRVHHLLRHGQVAIARSSNV